MRIAILRWCFSASSAGIRLGRPDEQGVRNSIASGPDGTRFGFTRVACSVAGGIKLAVTPFPPEHLHDPAAAPATQPHGLIRRCPGRAVAHAATCRADTRPAAGPPRD